MSDKIDRGDKRRLDRREFIKKAASGTLVVALGGGLYRIASEHVIGMAHAEKRPDGRPRLPPGQKVIQALKPMGGQPFKGSTASWSLKVHGEVEKPFTISWAELLAMKQSKLVADVHCVTGWSMLGGTWSGVRLSDLAKRAGLKSSARHVIFEAAHGYTANVSIKDALKPNVMVTHKLNGRSFATKHGAPVRSLVPDLYFWKSAKWLTGIRFVKRDQPGYWETRGYSNHADPWLEERYS